MSEPHKFIKLEDEIMLRRAMRDVYKNEGMLGIYQCMGELAQSLEIIGQVAQELFEEENNKRGQNDKQ